MVLKNFWNRIHVGMGADPDRHMGKERRGELVSCWNVKELDGLLG